MPIKAGDNIPSVTLRYLDTDGPKEVKADEFFKDKKAVLFGVPGAFTPTCSAKHVPGFLAHAKEIKAKGVDMIACIAPNDVFVVNAWGKDQNVGNEITMLSDGSVEFAKALGLEKDLSARGLGTRSERYAMIVDHGKVTKVAVDPSTFESTSAEAILKAL